MAQSRKNYGWGISVALNSTQSQFGVPLMSGSGAVIVDADGNILIGGKRADKSFSYSVIPKYQLKEFLTLRFELSLTKLELSAYTDQNSSDHILNEAKLNTSIFKISPGFQWYFTKDKIVESYCGITVSYGHYNAIHYEYLAEHRNLPTDTLLYSVGINEQTPGGINIGVGVLVGFNLFTSRKISFGAEISSSYTYYNFGGVTISEETGKVGILPFTYHTSEYLNSYTGLKLSKFSSSFNISYWF